VFCDVFYDMIWCVFYDVWCVYDGFMIWYDVFFMMCDVFMMVLWYDMMCFLWCVMCLWWFYDMMCFLIKKPVYIPQMSNESYNLESYSEVLQLYLDLKHPYVTYITTFMSYTDDIYVVYLVKCQHRDKYLLMCPFSPRLSPHIQPMQNNNRFDLILMILILIILIFFSLLLSQYYSYLSDRGVQYAAYTT